MDQAPKSQVPAEVDLETLKTDLERLQEVSAENAELARRLLEEPDPSGELHQRIDANVAEQSRIVDRFVSMSTDQETINHFRDTLAAIENNSKALEQIEDEEEKARLKEQVLTGIEEWITTLEQIIVGVMEKATGA